MARVAWSAARAYQWRAAVVATVVGLVSGSAALAEPPPSERSDPGFGQAGTVLLPARDTGSEGRAVVLLTAGSWSPRLWTAAKCSWLACGLMGRRTRPSPVPGDSS